MSNKCRRRHSKKNPSRNPTGARHSKNSTPQAQPLADLSQLLAAVAGFMVSAWLMFNLWISAINDYAWKVGALEGSLAEMWSEVSDLVRISTIFAGLAGGLWVVVMVRRNFAFDLNPRSTRNKVLVALGGFNEIIVQFALWASVGSTRSISLDQSGVRGVFPVHPSPLVTAAHPLDKFAG